MGPEATAAALKRQEWETKTLAAARDKPHGTLGIVAPKTPEPAVIPLDVAEELRAGRVQTLKHVAQIAELRARTTSLEGWKQAVESQRAITMGAAVTAVITAIGTLVYLLLGAH